MRTDKTQVDTKRSAADDPLAAALDWACSQPAWWHDSGNLNPAVLRAIANHAMSIGAKEAAETGCGLSTILLSQVAESHTCFTIAAGNSLERVQNVPHLRNDRVNFVVGPSQVTLPRHGFVRPLDFVLIDGPHGFPFAHLEYYFFYPRIRKGGFLVVDDIHIPTIRQMYDVLRDDKMWLHVEDVLTTAFFQRSEAPLFDPYGDGWERQQFNQRHFEDSKSMDLYSPGWRDTMSPPPGPLLGVGRKSLLAPVPAQATADAEPVPAPRLPTVTCSSCSKDIAERVNSIDWFHSIDLGNGLITRGQKSLEVLAQEQRVIFDPVKIEGATVLDVGAWAGAHSFAAKRRGAARVLATDHYVWIHEHWRGREAFDIANSALGLEIEAMEIDVPQIAPATVGLWDVVLFLGVLYHLPSPLEGLEAVASVATDCLIVETQTDLINHRTPALAYYPGNSLNADVTNFFGPNPAFVIEALRECQFTIFDTNIYGKRLTVHAWRNTKRRALGDAPEVHSRVAARPLWRRFASRAKRSLSRRSE